MSLTAEKIKKIFYSEMIEKNCVAVGSRVGRSGVRRENMEVG
jgi:hypothetical protein